MIDECKAVMLRPLVWGWNDCVAGAGLVFLRVWGVDPIAEIRGKWRTRREAEALLEKIGGWDAFEGMFRKAGLKRGDEVGSIVLTGGDYPGLGIKVAHSLWAGKSMRGMVMKTSKEIRGSWCLR